jgi:hypothetical protein
MKMKSAIEKTCFEEYEKNLFQAVMRQMGATWPEVWEYPMDYRDASAGVSGFTYYSETKPFAKRNIEDILACLNTFEDEIGEPLKKDNDNLLNWYAWFALEHIIDKIVCLKEV